MNKLQVKEHLHNGALYQPVTEASLSEEWKHRLLYRYTVDKQLKAALQERTRFLNPLIIIAVPVICILIVFAAYFGFLHPGHWLEKLVSVADFDIPQIGLKEILVFAAAVNGLTFLIKKREFWL